MGVFGHCVFKLRTTSVVITQQSWQLLCR